MAQKPKKILYIITKSVWGGAGKYVFDLATSLPHDQFFNVLVAAGGEGELKQKIKSKSVNYCNIKNFQRDVGILKDFLAFFEILTLLFKTRPDIVHVSSSKAGGLAGPAIFLYKIFALRFSLCTIFTVHGWAFNEPRPPLQIKLIKIFSWLTCLFYKKIICVSEFDRQAALKHKIAPARKLITIHNGIKPEDYNFLTKEKAREKIGQPNNQVLIGTIGENTKNKGHEYLKRALPDAVIIHDLPQGYNYLKAFDIFVLPSLKEGLPYILLEAGLARLPVVATRVGGVPEIIINEETGLLVKPGRPDEIKNAVEKLTDEPELKNRIAFNLWEKINREFSFKKMLDSTLSTYQ